MYQWDGPVLHEDGRGSGEEETQAGRHHPWMQLLLPVQVRTVCVYVCMCICMYVCVYMCMYYIVYYILYTILEPGDTIPGCNSFFLCKYVVHTVCTVCTILYTITYTHTIYYVLYCILLSSIPIKTHPLYMTNTY
jgi:hypothetical protein